MKTEVYLILAFSFYIFLPSVQVSNYFYHQKKKKIINSNKTSAEVPGNIKNKWKMTNIHPLPKNPVKT